MGLGDRVPDQEMSFLDHIAELRRRLLWVAVTFFLAAVGASFFSPQMVAFLIGPAKDGLVVLRPGEAFYVHIQVALAAAVVMNIPIILYHIFAFIFPGLTPSEKKWVYLSVPPILGLFVGGILFAWFVVIPVVYRFFMGFTSEALAPFISVGHYVSFVTGLVIPFGVIFELPVLIAALTGIGILTPAFLSKYRKIAILMIFIVAALLTPPDVVSQTLLAIPLIALFEASLGVSRIIYSRRQKAIARREAELAEYDEVDEDVA